MRIRSKLLLLVVAVMVMMSLGTVLFIWSDESARALEREKGVLSDLTRALEAQNIAVNRVAVERFADKNQTLIQTSQSVDDAFARIDGIHGIAGISQDASNALAAIRDLKTLADQRLQVLYDRWKPVRAAADTVFNFPKDAHVRDFYTYDFTPKVRPAVTAALPLVASLLEAVETMNDTLSRSTQTIDEQFQVIDDAVGAAEARATLVTAALAAAVLVLTLVMALLQANGFARSIIAIGRHIARLKDGDIASRTHEKRRDEIGILAGNLNEFGDSLAAALLEIRSVSESNLVRKNALSDSAGDASAAITQIAANARSIEAQIHTLHEQIRGTSTLVADIVGDLEGLNRQLDEHHRLNGQSTSSVTGMIRDLGGLRSSAASGRQSISDLREAAQRGNEVFQQANRKIADVPRYIGGITEMAKVITGLSEQTNLLAMNAAIEAAHAGNSGRGFAVVATEIRKLAEESAQSSARISQSIRDVVAVITEATDANRETVAVFGTVNAQVSAVADSIESMFGALASIQEGGEAVLGSLSQANEAAQGVAAGTASVDRSTQSIRSVMGDVGRVSDEVAANIAEITQGVQSIDSAFSRLAVLTAEVGEGSVTLDREVHRFKLSEEEQA